DDVTVADCGHRLKRPPDGEDEGGEAVLVEEADGDRSRQRKPDERRCQGKRDRARIGDLLDAPLDEHGSLWIVSGSPFGHRDTIRRSRLVPWLLEGVSRGSGKALARRSREWEAVMWKLIRVMRV